MRLSTARCGLPQLFRRQHGGFYTARPVTPVLRDVDTLGMADIEKKIKSWQLKAVTAS